MEEIINVPYSKESEMMVLGCMLNHHNDFITIVGKLDDADFYCLEHKTIFKCLKALYKKGNPADILLVLEELKRQDIVKAFDGAAYLTTLAQYSGISAYVEKYVEELKQLRQGRALIRVGQSLVRAASKKIESAKIILDVEKELRQIADLKYSTANFLIKSIAELDVDWLEQIPPRKKMLLDYVDENGYTHGFIPKGNVCMVVGMGGIGKSHWVAQLAISTATLTRFLELFTPTNYCQGGIFLGLAENDMEDIWRLIHKSTKRIEEKNIKDTLKRRLYPFSFQGHQCQFFHEGKPSSYFYELKSHLINRAPASGWALIILDPISRFLGAEAEADNAAATAFVALMEQLTQELPGNPTILFCHHMNKSAIQGNSEGQHAARGSSAITDGVRLQINLAKKTIESSEHNMPEEMITMIMSKSNFTKIIKEINLKKEDDGYLSTAAQKSIPLEHRSKVKRGKKG